MDRAIWNILYDLSDSDKISWWGASEGGLIRGPRVYNEGRLLVPHKPGGFRSAYDRCYKAYERIYKRVGVPEVISVASDSGMMGGSISYEFMLLTPIGEDSHRDLRGVRIPGQYGKRRKPLCAVPGMKFQMNWRWFIRRIYTMIEDICHFLETGKEHSCKAVVYQRNSDDRYIVLFIRGDLEVNETKLTNYLGYEIHPAVTEESGPDDGWISWSVQLKGGFYGSVWPFAGRGK